MRARHPSTHNSQSIDTTIIVASLANTDLKGIAFTYDLAPEIEQGAVLTSVAVAAAVVEQYRDRWWNSFSDYVAVFQQDPPHVGSVESFQQLLAGWSYWH